MKEGSNSSPHAVLIKNIHTFCQNSHLLHRTILLVDQIAVGAGMEQGEAGYLLKKASWSWPSVLEHGAGGGND